MKNKHFVITVSMLPSDSLKEVTYSSIDLKDLPPVKSCFPGIPLIEWNLAKDDDNIRISLIMTDDENHRSGKNLKVLKEELTDLSKRLGKQISITDTINVPDNETREKQIEMFRKLIAVYNEDTEIYADITYGTKVTPICIFASLVYAEKFKKSRISSIIYGRYAHDGSTEGHIYDIRSIYELNMFVNTATKLPNSNVDEMIDLIWGSNEE